MGEKKYFEEAQSWFAGLAKVYDQRIWETKAISYHQSGIVWESLALVGLHLPTDSTFYTQLLEYIHRFESWLRTEWQAQPSHWSFATARAVVLRTSSKDLKQTKAKKKRKDFKQWGLEHVARLLGRPDAKAARDGKLQEGILAKIGTLGYTCGPLQGLAPLAELWPDAEMIQVLLNLLERNIDTYQLHGALDSDVALPWAGLEAQGFDIAGAFFRDETQLKQELRRSQRVDDVGMCVVALTQALSALDHYEGVEIGGGSGEPSMPDKGVDDDSKSEL
eukprot:TRINITY_DN51880_c0_g1_i2.p1 TRINITY_DN51880_c0_g1~~TRINITY_DN51880_c0_g1_i2.p1  ORF type:complete len:277 (-),score=57.30 TRINITY_DN51880_c0_g1_i2:16-846(-)